MHAGRDGPIQPGGLLPYVPQEMKMRDIMPEQVRGRPLTAIPPISAGG